MRSSSLIGLVVVGLLASACGDKDQAPPPKTPETTAVATTTAPPPPPPVDTTPPPPPPAPKPSLAEMQQKAGQTIMEGFNAHDAKKVASVYADDAVSRMAGAPADMKGKDAIAAGTQGVFDAFSNFKSATQFAFVKNDVVVVVWQMTGTHSGNFFGVKATEKPVGWTGASVLWFNADGQIKEEHIYWDVATVMAQVGAAKGMKARAIPALAAQPTMIVATGSDAEQKNLDGFKGWYSTFEAKTPDAFIAPLADDVEWDDLANPSGVMKGTKVAKSYFTDLKKGFPDVKVQVANAWAVGDFVIAENVMTGTQTGPFMGKPASKKALNLHGVDIAQMKDGKVTKGWSFANGGEMGMQLGWIKMPDPNAKSADPKAPATPAKAPTTPAKK